MDHIFLHCESAEHSFDLRLDLRLINQWHSPLKGALVATDIVSRGSHREQDRSCRRVYFHDANDFCCFLTVSEQAYTEVRRACGSAPAAGDLRSCRVTSASHKRIAPGTLVGDFLMQKYIWQ